MRAVESVLPVKNNRGALWIRYLLDTALALCGSFLVTGILYIFQLYPRIPNISIVYLFVVLALATTRGRYASILASFVAFLAFDYFLVPPLYVFTISRVEEWVALFVFLVTALLTSQLAVALRERAEQASRREHETRLLYDLVRSTNREAEPERQLHAIAQAVVDVLSPWGVHDCAILQPDARGTLQPQASAYQPVEGITLSSDEQAIAAWVMTHGRTMGLYDDSSLATSTSASFVQRVVVWSTATGRAVRRSLRLIPLRRGHKTIGVLRLRILDDAGRFPSEERLEDASGRAGSPVTFFWTFLDQVTALVERARLQQDNLRIAILQRTDALRAALLSSVSHDLRTPLTSIKAAATSLLQDDVQWDEEARRSFAQSIEHEADRLNRLVENLLDMSRIEDGALVPERDEYSLTSLIHDVLRRLSSLLDGREVRVDLPNDLLLVDVDYMEIDQVLTNLMENAVRYTPPESPIELSACVDGDEVVVQVADHGPGIPPADLERIFDKFYRVVNNQNGQHTRTYPTGSGLGLAVCKGLVEAHGGRIWASLREKGGLVVSMTLPRSEKARAGL
ncbi:MAG TPA: ATP-binding protein [Ktedonobacteraceae bacterium]|nr:ATP-binding protein [Ktedonobacteraceae bacterium]